HALVVVADVRDVGVCGEFGCPTGEQAVQHHAALHDLHGIRHRDDSDPSATVGDPLDETFADQGIQPLSHAAPTDAIAIRQLLLDEPEARRHGPIVDLLVQALLHQLAAGGTADPTGVV